jgi:serine/threonine protein kinase
LYWKQDESEKFIVSLISTLSYLQSVGICHRDLKPANLFLNPTSGEMKIIDFGESKDYFKDGDDGGPGTMATIRGTPQYLSPLLWRAHVEEGGNTRHVTHNIFKSDVFSCGLIFYQMCAMEDVTGFNQKNQVNDGEKMIDLGLKKLRQRYSDHIIEIIRLMLKFDENERPSFIELAKLVLTSTENTIDSPKVGKQPIGGSGSSAAI